MNKFANKSLTIVAALSLFGCAHTAHLTQDNVIRIAKQAAERQGFKLADYKNPDARFEFTRKDKTWVVFFDGKIPMPGNFFSVSVDDQTSKTEVWPGE